MRDELEATGPEKRVDPLTGRTSIISSGRARRPRDFATQAPGPDDSKDRCPFCLGAEKMTPPEVYAIREEDSGADTSDWSVRIVPNKYPILNREGGSAGGIHEVVIHSPDHEKELDMLPLSQVGRVMRAYRDRYHQLSLDDAVRIVTIIINHGHDAGASLAHPHSQLFGMTESPPVIDSELRFARRRREETGECIYCSVIESELGDGSRVISEDQDFLVIAPYASRVPLEMMLIPKAHSAQFGQLDEDGLHSFAEVLHNTLSRLAVVMGKTAYNLVIHSGPVDGSFSDSYHWHVELLPRLSKQAGFELATGYHVNPVSPELAATMLRG